MPLGYNGLSAGDFIHKWQRFLTWPISLIVCAAGLIVVLFRDGASIKSPAPNTKLEVRSASSHVHGSPAEPRDLLYVCVQGITKQGVSVHVMPCCRQKTVKEPVASFVCEILPEQMRESTRTELMYEDLVRLPPTEVSRIAEWLMEKVDSYTVRVRPEPTPEEEVRLICIVVIVCWPPSSSAPHQMHPCPW